MDPSGFVVGKCPKNWLLSVVSGWKGSEGLLEIGSMLNFFGKSVGAARLSFSVVVPVGLLLAIGVVTWLVVGMVDGIWSTSTPMCWGVLASCSQACIFIGIVIELGVCIFVCFCVWGQLVVD